MTGDFYFITFSKQDVAKFSRGGGAKTYYLPKKSLKSILFSFKKVEKYTILAGQGEMGQVPPLALPCGGP
jgi:hypothetical protein